MSSQPSRRALPAAELGGVLLELADRSGLALCVAQDGRYAYVNAAFARLFGYTVEELSGRELLWDLVAEEDRQRVQDSLKSRLGDGENLAQYRFSGRRRDGSGFVAQTHALRVSLGGKPAVASSIMDVTEHHQLEGQYLQAQKMESVGRLAGGIAHDFNNILSAILGYAQLAAHESQSQEARVADLEEIERSAKRAAGLVRQLLAFSRRQVIRLEALDLNRLILNLEKMLRRLIGEDVRLEVALAPSLASVRADPGQLEQVIVNMAVNARDAMPKGGVLVVETSAAVLDEEFARRHPEAKPGEYVLLAISDNGSGITPEAQTHLFEPYFTTKEVGRGTGLGLATCYGIVRQHGGYIWVYSELGKGTVFKIYLPKAETAAAERSLADSPAALPRGDEVILLAEDEPSVRLLAARVLRRQGYQVHEAANGQDALRVEESLKGGRIDLLLTDVVMPLMGGRDLHTQLLLRRPGLRTLFMSGYTDDAILHTSVLQDGAHFLEKPLLMDLLVLKVREILDKPGPA